MKKLYTAIIACLLILSLTGCGQADQKNQPETTPPTAESVPTTPTEPPVPLYQDLAATGTVIELGQTVDGKVISVTLDAVYSGSADGYCVLKLKIQNKSDAQIVVSDMTYIDNYYALGGSIISVNAGQTSTLEFSYSEIGLGSFGGLEVPSSQVGKIAFTISAREGFMTENYKEVEKLSLVHYPKGKEAWDSTPVRQLSEGEVLLLDNDSVQLVARGETTDLFGESTQSYYLENKTDQDLTFVFEGAAGYLATPFAIPAGCRMLINSPGKMNAVLSVTDSSGRVLCEEAVKYTP